MSPQQVRRVSRDLVQLGMTTCYLTLSTHLVKGSHNLLSRHPNHIWEKMAEGCMYARMIADGFHLGDAV